MSYQTARVTTSAMLIAAVEIGLAVGTILIILALSAHAATPADCPHAHGAGSIAFALVATAMGFASVGFLAASLLISGKEGRR